MPDEEKSSYNSSNVCVCVFAKGRKGKNIQRLVEALHTPFGGAEMKCLPAGCPE